MKQQYIIVCLLTIAFTTYALPLLAQLPPPTPPQIGAPIDGGLSLLIAAGAGYGVKKLREKRNKQEGNK